ncbi:MAG: hypothetical protein RR286_02565 [Mucinivorans sp.]
MKKIILIALLIGAVGLSTAQNQRDIQVDNLSIQSVEQTLNINFDILCGSLSHGRNHKLILTPVLYNGSVVQNMTPIVIETRRSAIMDYRNRVSKSSSYTFPTNTSVVNYSAQLPLEQWMDMASLSIKAMLSGCCSVKQLSTKLLASNIVINPPVAASVFKAHYAYIVPTVESLKQRSQSGTAYLQFAPGSSILVGDFANNTVELAKIVGSIDMVRADKDVQLREIALCGTCSPEGSWQNNALLAQKRTAQVQRYIQDRFTYPSSIFSMSFQPEDWALLATLIEQSPDVPEREALLNIINSSDLPDTKDSRIASLGGGVPYRYLLSYLYPKLRRVDYSINYNVRAFDLQRSKEVLEKNPQNLSLSEMYLIAQSYPSSSVQFAEIFTIAARLYPEDPTANINAATSALQRGDSTGAIFYLHRVTETSVAQYQNTLGLLLLSQGQQDKACSLFTLAAASGLTAATDNLNQL